MVERIRGLWRARVLVALDETTDGGHFNSLGRRCGFSTNPKALSRILKRMLREGHATRTIDRVGPPTLVTWRLTDEGRRLVDPARMLIAQIDAKHDDGRHKISVIDTGRVAQR
jgi:DNA-binding HxlR family transcriptional regulator